ncbi:hypothetical protein [Bacteriovorax stolpii]|nr:hypothetical protein [Bacteriovorax stolpii]
MKTKNKISQELIVMMPEEMQATIGTLLLFFAMVAMMCLRTL